MCAPSKNRRRGAIVAALGGSSSSVLLMSHVSRDPQQSHGLVLSDILFAGGIVIMLAAVALLCFSLRHRR